MRWRQRIDYHGSRSYRSEEPPPHQSGHTSGLLTNFVRNLRELFARPPTSKVLLTKEERHFSLLGTSMTPRGRAEDCAFPTESKPEHNSYDWRVLP